MTLVQAGAAALTLTLLGDIDSFSSLLLVFDTQKSASGLRCGSTFLCHLLSKRCHSCLLGRTVQLGARILNSEALLIGCHAASDGEITFSSFKPLSDECSRLQRSEPFCRRSMPAVFLFWLSNTTAICSRGHVIIMCRTCQRSVKLFPHIFQHKTIPRCRFYATLPWLKPCGDSADVHCAV